MKNEELKKQIEAIIKKEIHQSNDGTLWGEDTAAELIYDLLPQQQPEQNARLKTAEEMAIKAFAAGDFESKGQRIWAINQAAKLMCEYADQFEQQQPAPNAGIQRVLTKLTENEAAYGRLFPQLESWLTQELTGEQQAEPNAAIITAILTELEELSGTYNQNYLSSKNPVEDSLWDGKRYAIDEAIEIFKKHYGV